MHYEGGSDENSVNDGSDKEDSMNSEDNISEADSNRDQAPIPID